MPTQQREHKSAAPRQKAANGGLFGMTVERQEKWAIRLLDIAIGAVLILSMFILKGVTENQKEMARTQATILERLAGIEANRFTAKDGLEVWQEISLIREHIAKMPTEVPPVWFLERVKNIEQRLSDLEDDFHFNQGPPQ